MVVAHVVLGTYIFDVLIKDSKFNKFIELNLFAMTYEIPSGLHLYLIDYTSYSSIYSSSMNLPPKQSFIFSNPGPSLSTIKTGVTYTTPYGDMVMATGTPRNGFRKENVNRNDRVRSTARHLTRYYYSGRV